MTAIIFIILGAIILALMYAWLAQKGISDARGEIIHDLIEFDRKEKRERETIYCVATLALNEFNDSFLFIDKVSANNENEAKLSVCSKYLNGYIVKRQQSIKVW